MCRVQFQYLQPAAGSLEPGLLSLYLQRPSHWDQLDAHTHTCAQTQMHHALNYTFFICVNVGSIKYQLVRPQPATWASDKFESQLSGCLTITRPGEARCHSTQCSHPLYLLIYPPILYCTVLYCTVLYCTVLYCFGHVAECAVFPFSVSVLPLL